MINLIISFIIVNLKSYGIKKNLSFKLLLKKYNNQIRVCVKLMSLYLPYNSRLLVIELDDLVSLRKSET